MKDFSPFLHDVKANRRLTSTGLVGDNRAWTQPILVRCESNIRCWTKPANVGPPSADIVKVWNFCGGDIVRDEPKGWESCHHNFGVIAGQIIAAGINAVN